jgi:AcrR family transcriptional regulator
LSFSKPRTRQALHLALAELLHTTSFERISVQQLAEAASINRVTFYDHYPDKFALLEGMVAARFDELLAGRGLSCDSAIENMILAVCDFLGDTVCDSQRQLDLYLQAAVLAVVRQLFVDGMRRHSEIDNVEMVATAMAGALCAAAREWLRSPQRGTSADAVPVIARLVAPIFSS